MVTETKKKYMSYYNQLLPVKAKKAEYMRRIRAEQDKNAAQNLVRSLLDLGYENLAFEYAKERAPEMLITAKVQSRRRKE